MNPSLSCTPYQARTNSDLPGQETGRGAPAGEGEEEPQHEDRGQVQGEGHRAAMLPCLPLGTDGDRSPPPPQRPSHPLPARHGIQPEVPGGRGNRERTYKSNHYKSIRNTKQPKLILCNVI